MNQSTCWSPVNSWRNRSVLGRHCVHWTSLHPSLPLYMVKKWIHSYRWKYRRNITKLSALSSPYFTKDVNKRGLNLKLYIPQMHHQIASPVGASRSSLLLANVLRLQESKASPSHDEIFRICWARLDRGRLRTRLWGSAQKQTGDSVDSDQDFDSGIPSVAAYVWGRGGERVERRGCNRGRGRTGEGMRQLWRCWCGVTEDRSVPE